MIEATVRLDVSGERRYYCLSSRNKPFEDSRFKSLGVVTSCTRRSFTYLPEVNCDDITISETY
jgi:hypothetical protein